MLDSMLCALGPLVYMTSFIPDVKGIESGQMVMVMRTRDFFLLFLSPSGFYFFEFGK